MKRNLTATLIAILTISLIQPCNAHVLVFRARLTSGIKVDANGTTRDSWPSTLSSLIVLDLDADYVSELNDISENNPNREWEAPEIQINEKPKSGNKPAEYSFRTDYDRNYNSLSAWRQIKFEFYGKNDTNFYLFHYYYQDFGVAGVEHNAATANGPCSLNVDIGGDRKSAVPKDFTATLKGGSNKAFTTNVYSVKYDAVITKAVNTYLAQNNIKSTKGSKHSQSRIAALNWLAETYLPPRYTAPYPY